MARIKVRLPSFMRCPIEHVLRQLNPMPRLSSQTVDRVLRIGMDEIPIPSSKSNCLLSKDHDVLGNFPLSHDYSRVPLCSLNLLQQFVVMYSCDMFSSLTSQYKYTLLVMPTLTFPYPIKLPQHHGPLCKQLGDARVSSAICGYTRRPTLPFVSLPKTCIVANPA
jgi:hypothetical protein